MLGITTPDAIAVGTLILAVLAAWRGGSAGDSAKKAEPPPTTPLQLGMATFADTAAMNRLVDALEAMTKALLLSIDAADRRYENKLAHAIEELEKHLRK